MTGLAVQPEHRQQHEEEQVAGEDVEEAHRAAPVLYHPRAGDARFDRGGPQRSTRQALGTIHGRGTVPNNAAGASAQTSTSSAPGPVATTVLPSGWSAPAPNTRTCTPSGTAGGSFTSIRSPTFSRRPGERNRTPLGSPEGEQPAERAPRGDPGDHLGGRLAGIGRQRLEVEHLGERAELRGVGDEAMGVEGAERDPVAVGRDVGEQRLAGLGEVDGRLHHPVQRLAEVGAERGDEPGERPREHLAKERVVGVELEPGDGLGDPRVAPRVPALDGMGEREERARLGGAAHHLVDRRLRRGELFGSFGERDQVADRGGELAPGDQEHAVHEPRRLVRGEVVLGEDHEVEPGLLRGADDLLLRAAAVVRPERVDVVGAPQPPRLGLGPLDPRVVHPRADEGVDAEDREEREDQPEQRPRRLCPGPRPRRGRALAGLRHRPATARGSSFDGAPPSCSRQSRA